jgi:hypothetical protein
LWTSNQISKSKALGLFSVLALKMPVCRLNQALNVLSFAFMTNIPETFALDQSTSIAVFGAEKLKMIQFRTYPTNSVISTANAWHRVTMAQRYC